VKFDNLAEMVAQPTADLDDGELAYVLTLRDFFVLEKTVNSGSIKPAERIAGSGGGIWYRLSLTEPYWKNQTRWFINGAAGSDENLGSVDKPLETHDELVRRILSTGKLTNDYLVFLVGATPIAATYAVDVELAGGSITYVSQPSHAALANVDSNQGAVDYVAADVPHLECSALDGTQRVLHSQGGSIQFVGLAASGSTGQTYLTAFTSSFVGETLLATTYPILQAPLVSVRGQGTVVFQEVELAAERLSVAPGARLRLERSLVEAEEVSMAGGRIELERTLIRATLGDVLIHDGAEVLAQESAFQTDGQRIVVKENARLESGASTFWGSTVDFQSARGVFGATGTSGSAIVGSSVEVASDAVVDARNIFSSGSYLGASPFSVVGQGSTVYYDDVALPKTEPILINNGMVMAFSWSSGPWDDMLRDVRIVSGALRNTW
jgi:hypothetical protein